MPEAGNLESNCKQYRGQYHTLLVHVCWKHLGKGYCYSHAVRKWELHRSRYQNRSSEHQSSCTDLATIFDIPLECLSQYLLIRWIALGPATVAADCSLHTMSSWFNPLIAVSERILFTLFISHHRTCVNCLQVIFPLNPAFSDIALRAGAGSH